MNTKLIKDAIRIKLALDRTTDRVKRKALYAGLQRVLKAMSKDELTAYNRRVEC